MATKAATLGYSAMNARSQRSSAGPISKSSNRPRQTTSRRDGKNRQALAPVSLVGLGPGRLAPVRIGRAGSQPDEVQHVDSPRPIVGAKGGERLLGRIDVAGHTRRTPSPVTRSEAGQGLALASGGKIFN